MTEKYKFYGRGKTEQEEEEFEHCSKEKFQKTKDFRDYY